MLRLSPQQLSAMEQRADEEYALALAALLRDELPAELHHLSEDDLLRATRAKIREAKMAGLSYEDDIALYVYASARLAPHFPAATPALYDRLANDSVSYDDRCDALETALREGVS